MLIGLLLGTTGKAGAGAMQTVTLEANHPQTAALTTRADAARQLNVHVSFAPRHRAELNRLLEELQDPASPGYHLWLTPAQFDARFGRAPAEAEAVSEWLIQHGFVIAQVSPHEVMAGATVADAESTFATTIASSIDGAVYGNLDDPRIPRRFAGIIASIEGLDNTRHSQPWTVSPRHAKRRSARIEAEAEKSWTAHVEPAAMADYHGRWGTAFGPSDLWTFYDEAPLISAGTDGGSGDCIALIEDTDFLSSSVTLFDTTFGLPTASITRILADGSNPGRNGDEIEALLDIEWAHATAPGAPLRVYIGDPATAAIDPLVDALKEAVSDNQCGAISVSYGYCGGPNSFYSGTLDPIFAQAAAQGQTVFISSGDQGSAGIVLNGAGTACVTGTRRNVSEMAADPNVVGVGGTQFSPNYDGSGNDLGNAPESAWQDTAGAGGGGKSRIFGKPAWQASVTPADGKRDVPDVALGASPYFPGFYWGADSGGRAVMACCIGGTSIAAPLWAGLGKVTAEISGGRLGNMNPRIYKLGALRDAAKSGLRDVTSGDNGYNHVAGYRAVAGYDQSTGWGSADMATFASVYASATPSPAPTGPAELSPGEAFFGLNRVGTVSAARLVAVANPLSNKMQLVISRISLSAGPFVVDPSITTCGVGMSLAAGARCHIGVRFAPIATGWRSGRLTISDNSSNGPHQVQLLGAAL